jgi:hypothetical protein
VELGEEAVFSGTLKEQAHQIRNEKPQNLGWLQPFPCSPNFDASSLLNQRAQEREMSVKY